jgi:hypothetical protein
MERLLEDAEAGFPLLDEGGDEAGDDDGLEALLPRLGHDHVQLNDLIERTEAVAREAGFAQAPGAAAPHGRD